MIELCAECGGAAIEPDGSECRACEGYGTQLVTDEGPEEEPVLLDELPDNADPDEEDEP